MIRKQQRQKSHGKFFDFLGCGTVLRVKMLSTMILREVGGVLSWLINQNFTSNSKNKDNILSFDERVSLTSQGIPSYVDKRVQWQYRAVKSLCLISLGLDDMDNATVPKDNVPWFNVSNWHYGIHNMWMVCDRDIGRATIQVGRVCRDTAKAVVSL